jgi:ribulose-phosphate 3-epimerase
MAFEHKIAPSILSANFACLGEEIRRVEEAGADLIHFDVMDGHFVPNLSIGVPVLKSLRKITRLPLDTHLMISEPARYLRAFVEAGANSISVHAEVCDDLAEIAAQIHALGARASVAINPETPPERVLAAAEHLDMILVMSVHPGFGGQGFIPESLEKLRAVRREIERRGLKLDIEVDGGIKIDNIAAVAEAGANVFVSGSGIFGHGDYHKIIAEMREQAARAGAARTRADGGSQ